MVASSISITGMSSLMGYTRLQVAHFSAVPFLTSVTGVLQFGHARISSNSGSTAIPGLYDTFPLLWNNSSMQQCSSRYAAGAALLIFLSGFSAAASAAQAGT